MTLIIRDPTGASTQQIQNFHDAVVRALGQICPAADFSVSDQGQVNSTQKGGGCGEYCEHRGGCNLMGSVLRHSELGNLTLKLGTSRYYSHRHQYQPLTLYWDASSDAAGLAHELIHAFHDYAGTYQTEWKFEEFCTVCSENIVRCELGLPARDEYASDKVYCDDPGSLGGASCRSLDVGDEWGCGCGDAPCKPLPPKEPKPPETVSTPIEDPVLHPDPGGLWECGCDSDVPDSPDWRKLGDAMVSTGVGGLVLPVGVYVREGDEGGCDVRLVGHCPRQCQEDLMPEREDIELADCMGEFGPLAPGDEPLDQIVRAANRIRCRNEARGIVEEVLDGLRRNSVHTPFKAILLERVSLLTSYGFMLLAVDDEGPVVITNFDFRPSEILFVGAHTIVVHRRLGGAFAADIPALVGQMAGLHEAEGGDPSIRDGQTMFLTVIDDVETRRAVLYGYQYAGFDSERDVREVDLDDRDTWTHVNSVIELWALAMGS